MILDGPSGSGSVTQSVIPGKALVAPLSPPGARAASMTAHCRMNMELYFCFTPLLFLFFMKEKSSSDVLWLAKVQVSM